LVQSTFAGQRAGSSHDAAARPACQGGIGSMGAVVDSATAIAIAATMSTHH
jgi:hypothetical protein